MPDATPPPPPSEPTPPPETVPPEAVPPEALPPKAVPPIEMQRPDALPPVSTPALPSALPPSSPSKPATVIPFAEPSASTTPSPALPPPTRGSVVLALSMMVIGTTLVIALLLGIAAAVVMGVRAYLREHRPSTTPALVAPAESPGVTPAVSSAPKPSAPPPLVALSPVPPPPEASPASPAPTSRPVMTGPQVLGISATTGNVGDPIVFRGRNLADVGEVILFPQHGGLFVQAAVMEQSDHSLTISVPAVEKPAGYQPGDGYYTGLFATTGALLLVDDTFHDAPRDTGASPAHNDALHVRRGQRLIGGNNLLVFADDDATVTVGDSCIVLMRAGCTLRGYGAGCKVFYKQPLTATGGTDIEGMKALPVIRLNTHVPRIVLEPLKPISEPPDPGE